MTCVSDDCRPNILSCRLTSSILGLNIFLSTLFSHSCSLCSSLKVRDQVAQSYKKYAKSVLHIVCRKAYGTVTASEPKNVLSVHYFITNLSVVLSERSTFYAQGDSKVPMPTYALGGACGLCVLRDCMTLTTTFLQPVVPCRNRQFAMRHICSYRCTGTFESLCILHNRIFRSLT
jgi:hypothetical protein